HCRVAPGLSCWQFKAVGGKLGSFWFGLSQSHSPPKWLRSGDKCAIQWKRISFNRLNGEDGLKLGKLHAYEHTDLRTKGIAFQQPGPDRFYRGRDSAAAC